MPSEFQQKYHGKVISALRWQQLDALWEAVKAQPEGWYAYFVSEELPQTTLSAAELARFIEEVDGLLRREHEYDYCGIVYADSFQEPSLIKIFDPHNLGSSCGSSGKIIPPRWLLSRLPPEHVEDEAPTPMGRKRWWQKIFS